MADDIKIVDEVEQSQASDRPLRRRAGQVMVVLGLAVWPLFVGAATLFWGVGQAVCILILVYCVAAIRDRPATWSKGRQFWILLWLVGWFVLLCDWPDVLHYAYHRYCERVASPLPEIDALVYCRGGEWEVGSEDPSFNDEQLLPWIPHLLHLQVVDLYLPNCRITDRGVESLKGLHSLKRLYLARTAITDDALRHMANLPELYVLDVRDTRVTDAGLRHLFKLKHLGVIELSGTQVTEAGVQELRKAIPNIDVCSR